MPLYRMQVEIAADSTLPRDRCVLTPHFDDHGVGTDPNGLCQDLATGIAAQSVSNREVRVTAYDAKGTVPVYPAGTAVVNEGTAPPSQCPREIALCLSFYADRNVKRHRGRIYWPWFMQGTPANEVRPSMTVANTVGTALASLFSGLGGADVDWVVFSRVDDTARKVQHWWIDDEWDTMRSRGLRSTTRVSGDTSG